MFDVEDRHWWYLGNHENFLGILNDHRILKQGINVLDAGCGTGGWLQILNRNIDINETGLDNRETALEFAKLRNIKNLVNGDVNNHEFPDSNFELITCFDVVYHKDVNDTMAVRNFNRSLKENGFLLITVPAYSFLYSKHDEVVHTNKRYSRKEIRLLLENNGFEIIKLSYSVSLLFPIALIKRLFDKILSSEKNEHNEVSMPPSLINTMFLSIMRFERWLMKFINFPFGLSVLALARKKT
jgi:SAM-dependent methyltransferase